jgi:hypothetical protein
MYTQKDINAIRQLFESYIAPELPAVGLETHSSFLLNWCEFYLGSISVFSDRYFPINNLKVQLIDPLKREYEQAKKIKKKASIPEMSLSELIQRLAKTDCAKLYRFNPYPKEGERNQSWNPVQETMVSFYLKYPQSVTTVMEITNPPEQGYIDFLTYSATHGFPANPELPDAPSYTEESGLHLLAQAMLKVGLSPTDVSAHRKAIQEASKDELARRGIQHQPPKRQ